MTLHEIEPKIIRKDLSLMETQPVVGGGGGGWEAPRYHLVGS